MPELRSIDQIADDPTTASAPRYDREALACGIAHIGLGNFHRSHQAYFLDQYLQTRPEPWMIHAIAPLPGDRDLVRAMQTQGGRYTLTTRSQAGDAISVIGSIKTVTHAPSDPHGVIDLLASDQIRIVSLTVTEKGYYRDTAGDLDEHDVAVRADLRPGSTPRTALGLLFAAAQQRMANHSKPFTIMSCDNLPGNGDTTKTVLLQFAELKAPEVAEWIRSNVSFPNSMVDRITPATTDATRSYVLDTYGVDDACPVVSEGFLQWVLEDDFIAGRPALETVGVQFVEKVEPYEVLKVRMLNGSHSALAYLSYLMGYRDVDLAMGDPMIRSFVQRYMDDDITPTIPEVPGIDMSAYKATLVERFSNPAVRDQVQRLAMDGSQKIRNAIVPPLEHQLRDEGSIRWMAFALAAWYRYLRATDEQGQPIEIVDPMRDGLVARAQQSPSEPVHFLAVQEIFGKELSADPRLTTAVKRSIDAIDELGTRGALHALLERTA